MSPASAGKPLAAKPPGKSPMCLPLLLFLLFYVVQLFSHVQLFLTPWTAAHQASLSFDISQSLLKLMSIVHVCTCMFTQVHAQGQEE